MIYNNDKTNKAKSIVFAYSAQTCFSNKQNLHDIHSIQFMRH